MNLTDSRATASDIVPVVSSFRYPASVVDHSSCGWVTRNPQNGNDCQSQEQFNELESGLPSFVPESDNVFHDSAAVQLTEIPNYSSANAATRFRVMNTQADIAGATQPISQSVYETILRKSRSGGAQEGEQDTENEEEQVDTQRTYEKGDSGHIDITSSFVTRQEQSEALANSDPVDVSPIQSPNQLTRYPESQRFKTPVTAGKKRRYNGDVVDTPAHVRNPLAVDGETVLDTGFGLSQAFAATQAASSPLSHGLPTGPKSDRPSPALELQTRPVTAASSSPSLRPIAPDLRRAATEPAARYVSLQQSQAERERQEISGDAQDSEPIDKNDGDDFDHEYSPIKRLRRQQERKERTKQELKSLSSPLQSAKDLPTSSPPKVTVPFQGHDQSADTSSAIAPPDAQHADTDEATITPSEDDTDQDDKHDGKNENEDKNVNMNIQTSSQVRGYTNGDKESGSVLVPKTGPRRPFGIGHAICEVDASPSLRHSTHASATSEIMEMSSSDPFRVMDSQPSQSRSRIASSPGGITQTASDIMDFAKQARRFNSTHGVEVNQVSGPDSTTPKNTFTVQSEVRPTEFLSSTEAVTSRGPGSVVQETNSDGRAGDPICLPVQPSRSQSSSQGVTNVTSEFETAPTNIGHSTNLRLSQYSSPVRNTPPGRKRRRMLEISAEPSPRKLRSQLSFDAQVVLQLDEDPETTTLLESSPSGRSRTTPKGKHGYHTPPSLGQNSGPDEAMSVILDEDDAGKSSCIPITTLTVSPETSQEVVGPARKGRSWPKVDIEPDALRQTISLSNRSRRSIFDIQASPEQATESTLGHERHKDTIETSRRRKTQAPSNYTSRMDKRLSPVVAAQGQKVRSIKPSTTISERISERLPVEAEHETVVVGGLPQNIVARDMVLAYYRGEPRGYYPARLLARFDDNRYTIQWDGYAPEEIDSYGVKALDLRVGDTVKVLADGFSKVPYIICGFKDQVTDLHAAVTDIRGYRTLTVMLKSRKSQSAKSRNESQRDVPVKAIYLDINMWAQMKARKEEISPRVDSKSISGVSTPFDRAVTPETPSSRGRRPTVTVSSLITPLVQGIFTNMAFAVSYDDSTQKTRVSDLILANGGIIIHDSFYDLLESENTALKAQYSEIGFTALLTDRHSRKEKYMQALALGLPCLSGRWIVNCDQQRTILDWQSYLLPAGESAALDNVTRSRILPSIDYKSVKLNEMLGARPNIFQGSRIVVVVGRGKVEIKRTPYVFLIQAMGAGHVHKVTDLNSAKEFLYSDEGQEYRWVFVDDKDVVSFRGLAKDSGDGIKHGRGRSGTKASGGGNTQPDFRVAGNELIVQSLILGQLYEN